MNQKITLVFVTMMTILSLHSQNVGIGTNNPNASAKLDITATNKGFLPPRVDLDDLATALPITSPAEGLIVYNETGDAPHGYYFWNGTKWVALDVQADNLGNHTATETLNMVNHTIDNANQLTFNDPGDQEGIIWKGSQAKIFVSPENSGNSDGYLRLINDDGILFESTGEDNETVIFDGNGNVGIGTIAPTEKLHISGNIRVSDLSGIGDRIVFVDANGVTHNDYATVSTNLYPSEDDMTKTDLLTSYFDDEAYNVNLGFNFNIGGVDYTDIWINTNGVLGFGTNSVTTFSNTSLPTSISTDPMLFFHWDDHSSDLIRYVVSGDAPSRIFSIYGRWDISASGGGADMYIIITLHEGSNILSVKYKGNSDWNNDEDQWDSDADAAGNSATIGFQFAGGSSAKIIPISYNSRIIDDNLEGGIPFISFDF